MESAGGTKLKLGLANQSRNPLLFNRQTLSQAHQHLPSSSLTSLGGSVAQSLKGSTVSSGSRFHFLKDSSYFNKESEKSSPQQQRPYDATTNGGGYTALRLSAAAAVGSRSNTTTTTSSPMLASSSHFANLTNSTISANHSNPNSTATSQESLLNRKKTTTKKRFSLLSSSSSDLVVGASADAGGPTNLGGSGTISSLSSSGATSSAASSSAASLDLILENHELLEWIEGQLESRGIDSVVYGRYILSLLHLSTDSLSESSSSGGGGANGAEDQDSGYGGNSSRRATLTGKSLATGNLASSTSTSASRYCDFHQHLYPGLNLHSSRTKLLPQAASGGSKSLNTQKPASTTKFMHRRYQNGAVGSGGGCGGGRGSSPISELLTTADYDDYTATSRHCPDCAARNNYDYRKVVLTDCLKDAIDQVRAFHAGDDTDDDEKGKTESWTGRAAAGGDSGRGDALARRRQVPDSKCGNIDSFVDELVSKFDRFRCSSQQQVSEPTTPAAISNNLTNHGASRYQVSNGFAPMADPNLTMDAFNPAFSGASSRRPFTKPFTSTVGNVNVATSKTTSSSSGSLYGHNNPNANHNSSNHKAFQHSRSFEQNAAPATSSAVGDSTDSVPWPRLSDSGSVQVTNGSLSGSNSRSNSSVRATAYQQSKLYHRSLSDDTAGAKGEDAKELSTTSTTTTSTNSTASSASASATPRDQALKYFAAFPALSGKFPGSRSVSSTQATLSSLTSPKSTASAKISAQSSLDDSVFSEDGSPASGGEQTASWNGLKIIKNISKSNVVSSMAASAAETASLSNGGALSSVGGVTTKPPTLSGKARVIVAAAPSSLLLDSSRDSSNFTTLKKKGSNSGSVSSSGASLSSAGPLRKSSSTTSTSSLEAEEAQKRSMTMPSSALAIVSTGRVATREQEKIFNIMPSFLNPLRGRESDRAAASSNSSTSKASMSLATSSVSVSSRKPPAASTAIASINSNGSSTSTSTANGPKLSDSNWSRGVSSSSSAFASATSSTTTLGQTQARTGRLRSVRPFAGGVDWTATGSATATTAVQSSSGPMTSTPSLHSSMAVDGVASSTCTSSGSTSSTISSAAVVDLLPSFLKSHSVSSGGGPSHTVASAFVASKQSNSSSSSAALSQLEESLPWTRSACHSTTTTTFNSGDATAAYSQAAEHSLAAATIYGSTSVAYQHKPPREVIRSAPTATSTTTTTSASLRSETASAAHWHLHQHHQKQQQQQYEPPGKPDWKTTGAYSAYTSLSANPSAASNSSGGCLTPKTVARAALGEPTALSGPTSSTLYASQSSNNRMIAPPPPPPYQNTVSQYRRFSPTPPPSLTTTTSTTSTAAAVTASTAALSAVDSSRLLNDYWFNFTNNKGEVTTTTDKTETESVEESRNRPDEATGSLRHHRTTAAAAAAGMMSISTNCLKGDVPYQTDNQHRTQMLNGAYNNTSGGEKDSAPRSAPSESSHQRSLVIDSKGALDEWMDSIRQQQKARTRLNAQVNNNSHEAPFVPQTQPQAQPQPHPQHHHQQPQPQSAHRPPSGKSASSVSPPLSVSEPKDATSGSLQGFLDSIMQSSTGPDPMASSPGLTCWRPLSSMYRTEDAAGLTDFTSNSKVDFVSYYWNQNCTLGYMDLLDDARTAANQIAAAGGGVVCESVGAKSPKSFQQFLDEQAAYRTEISLLSDLFHKSQRRPMATARTGPSTSFESLLSPGTDCLSSAAADPRISLANHESESSAFQEVPSLPSQNDLLLLLHDWTQGSDHSKVSSSACQQDSHPDAPQTSYFQPIEPEQLTTSGAGEFQTELEWTSFQLLQQQQQQETASDSQVKSTRPMAAASSRATTDSSSTVSRSLSASRAELDAYFTPELSTCSNVATSSCPGLTAEGTTTTTFYSSAGVPTSGSETELTQALVAPCTSTVLLPSERAVFPEKLSNSSCACKNSCNGHFIQTACCCYPDEYHCRLGLESPPEARMCDKSTTTTDQLLDAVNATLGTLFNHCAHHQQTPPPPNGSSCTTANNRCTTMNLFDMNDQQLADSFLASGGNFPLNGTLAATTTATSSFAHHPDEDEFNVTDLVNDVLRLHVAEQSNASGLNGAHLNVSSAEVNVESLPAVAAATSNTNALQDDFDGPPMPYSKRKKFQNAKEGKVYGQFPLSCAEMHQLRLMTQNKMSTATSSYYQRKPASATRGGATRTKAGAGPHLQSTVTSTSSANSSAIGTTVYYSNRSSVFSAFDATNSLLDSSPPSGETASQYTEQEGALALGSFEDGSYGTGEDGAGYYENDSFPEENGYILGPDGAEFYVPGESGGDSGERGGLSLSPEQLQLYAQYGADPFRVMNPDEGSPKDSVSSLFDLTFKTNNRTIDNTIDTVSKQSQKPCSFFMEGFCARGDCKFSHDLSSITCKYWMEGFCIREGSCPFLHGYANDGGQTSPPAVEQSKLDPNAKSFQFKICDFDFPALDDEGGLGAFGGIDLGAEPVPLSVSLDTASMCQAIFNSNSSNHRVNFNFKSSSAKSAKGKQLPMGGGGINGKTGAEQNANTSSAGEEEWPSLNGGGDSGANGFSQPMTVTGYKQAQADSSLSGGSYTDSLTFREKAVKAKKGGKYRSPGVGGGSSSGAATSASAQSNSSGSKGFAGVSLKGFL